MRNSYDKHCSYRNVGYLTVIQPTRYVRKQDATTAAWRVTTRISSSTRVSLVVP